jgi:hypothetical protein
LAGIPAFAAEKTVGVIMTGGIPYYKELHKAFSSSLAAEGFGSGSANIVVQILPQQCHGQILHGWFPMLMLLFLTAPLLHWR